ncbi:maleylpyruvate isomerase family mycothiol-dependent enzyme [Pseudofrankia inefficax]|uniref:Wyosine base formation n=1 Tax=Pseudofrankia inefficax (strain DSM 45817 / CECT 9037 / DDB 130130 / EuI1c) TaxID=298654 RepID=E3J0H6_PSEI1|nr:maleylpyruvate isomerase family mycothiol-dependent enzyme [Pseudofrankia inefficax]ADP81605.1 wyosine base formation [Pseudofrankia inefficax]
MGIFDDLEAELDSLDQVLAGLDQAAWTAPSAAAGWSVADVVLHLAQTEESVAETIAAGPAGTRPPVGATADDDPVDAAMDAWVRRERAEPGLVYARWRAARTASVAALRQADPDTPLTWVAAPLRPAVLATTRLSEHWAHALDITEPLAIPFPDTDRLRHVAWLAHRTLPYAFATAGEQAPPVRCELTAPDGVTLWAYGPPDASSVISGPAGAFCRVAARRLAPAAAGLTTRGTDAALALALLRTYAL